MSQSVYYAGLFFVSFLLTLLYVFRWHKQFNVAMTSLFVIMPIVNLSYFLLYGRQSALSLSLLVFVFLGACFLPWFTTMCEFNLCQIRVSRTLRMVLFIICAAVFFLDVLLVDSDLLYRSISMEQVGHSWVIRKEYGPLQIFHYIFMVFFFILDVGAIIYSFRKKKQVSRTVLVLLSLPIFLTMIGYLAGAPLAKKGYELTPLSYLLAQVVYLLIVRRMAYYNVSEMVIESLIESGEVGFITVDLEGRYLGSNSTARRILPELNLVTVDSPVGEVKALRDSVLQWITKYQEMVRTDRFLYPVGSIIYKVKVSDLYYGKKRCGFQIFLEDDSANQKYIRLLDHYNDELQTQVDSKTRRIVQMNDQFILGMAAMVESRDNSTGGHIRRTSECVRILMEEYRRDGAHGISEATCDKIIKAAPMHDLGKIAVSDAILRKPGRYTAEEFEVMKTHAAEGAKIVADILKDTDDDEFRRIAINMAHYHHERVDGSGYPEGLRGNEIPLEARIMAIADVYDALVSKRVYKESFSFEKANQIILEGMGTQFDEGLRSCYEAARPRLEEYYSRNA